MTPRPPSCLTPHCLYIKYTRLWIIILLTMESRIDSIPCWFYGDRQVEQNSSRSMDMFLLYRWNSRRAASGLWLRFHQSLQRIAWIWTYTRTAWGAKLWWILGPYSRDHEDICLVTLIDWFIYIPGQLCPWVCFYSVNVFLTCDNKLHTYIRKTNPYKSEESPKSL